VSLPNDRRLHLLSTEFCILNSLLKTSQNRIKIEKNSMIFAQNRSKVSENLQKLIKILQNLQKTCAFG